MSATDQRKTFTNTLQTPVSPTEEQGMSDLGAMAKDDLANVGDDLKHRAEAIGEEAKAQIGDMVDDVTEQARGLAAEQKDILVGHLEGVASALDRVASELEAEGESTAHYARMIADGADDLLTNIAEHDVDDLLEMAQAFGRRQPVAFLGAAALFGFAASRFVLASSARRADGVEGMKQTNSPSESFGRTATSPATPSANSTLGGAYGASTMGGGNGAV